MANIKLTGDWMDRGGYMMKVLNVINEYVPSRVFDVVDIMDLGPIQDSPVKREPTSLTHPHPVSINVRNQTKTVRNEPSVKYKSTLKHLDNEAFIMAVSGSWGSGKTKFVEILKDVLQDKGIEHKVVYHHGTWKKSITLEGKSKKYTAVPKDGNTYTMDASIPISCRLRGGSMKGEKTEYIVMNGTKGNQPIVCRVTKNERVFELTMISKAKTMRDKGICETNEDGSIRLSGDYGIYTFVIKKGMCEMHDYELKCTVTGKVNEQKLKEYFLMSNEEQSIQVLLNKGTGKFYITYEGATVDHGFWQQDGNSSISLIENNESQFILTSDDGKHYVMDDYHGIVSGNQDPYLVLKEAVEDTETQKRIILHADDTFDIVENDMEAWKDIDYISNTKLPEKNIISFDAWKNDFYDDPFEPFSVELVNHLFAPDEKEEMIEALRSFWSELKKGSWDVFNYFIGELPDAVVEETTGDPIKGRTKLFAKTGVYGFNRIRQGVKNVKEQASQDPADKELGNIETIKERVDKVHELLSNAIGKMEQRKVIVIVDELDRCKPTFAVKLLEIVKHLFNVKGLVFVFALDIYQLQHCIKKVYGNGFDAIGYLERFFDYTSILPVGNKKQLFENFAREYEMITRSEEINQYFDVCNSFHLTPRELKAVCSSFQAMKKEELKNEPDNIVLLYFFLSVIRYKYPDIVQQYLDGKIDRLETRDEKGKTHDLVVENWPKLLGETSENDINKSYKEFISEHVEHSMEKDSLESFYERMELAAMPMSVGTIPFKTEDIQRGTIIRFGRYYQDADGTAKTPIEWIVLEREGDELLLISKYALDWKQYNEEWVPITWADCTLRSWLNKEFMDKAFNEEEKKKIQKRKIENKDNQEGGTKGGIDTEDSMFLLSIDEVEKYFAKDEKRECKPTAYAVANGAYVSSAGNCLWWLRSPGLDGRDAADVRNVGSVDAIGDRVYYCNVGVRSALRINL